MWSEAWSPSRAPAAVTAALLEDPLAEPGRRYLARGLRGIGDLHVRQCLRQLDWPRGFALDNVGGLGALNHRISAAGVYFAATGGQSSLDVGQPSLPLLRRRVRRRQFRELGTQEDQPQQVTENDSFLFAQVALFDITVEIAVEAQRFRCGPDALHVQVIHVRIKRLEKHEQLFRE